MRDLRVARRFAGIAAAGREGRCGTLRIPEIPVGAAREAASRTARVARKIP